MTKIKLRSLSIDDANKLYEITHNDWTLHHNWQGAFCETIEDAETIINDFLNNETQTPFVIYTDQIDFLGLMLVVNKSEKTIELSSFISKDYRGHGFGVMALHETFKKYPGYNVQFEVPWDHHYSQRVMKKIGAFCYKEDYEIQTSYYMLVIPKEQNS